MIEKEGGLTRHYPSRETSPIFDAAQRYRAEGVPMVLFAGEEYGIGSARDWAAKATKLVGIGVVIAGSFEKIHRSNLVGMGVLPLQLPSGASVDDLALTGEETVDVIGLGAVSTPR